VEHSEAFKWLQDAKASIDRMLEVLTFAAGAEPKARLAEADREAWKIEKARLADEKLDLVRDIQRLQEEKAEAIREKQEAIQELYGKLGEAKEALVEVQKEQAHIQADHAKVITEKRAEVVEAERRLESLKTQAEAVLERAKGELGGLG